MRADPLRQPVIHWADRQIDRLDAAKRALHQAQCLFVDVRR
jgi:hypothetical protein